MSRALTRDLAALLLTGLGVGLASFGGDLCPRTLALAVATLTAFGTTASWGLGLLTLGLGLASHPLDRWPLAPSLTLVGAGLAGTALGFLGRWLASARWHGPLTPEALRGVLLLLVPLLAVMEPTTSRLADEAGQPLRLALTVTDPTTLATVDVSRHLPLPDAVVAKTPLASAMPWLAGLAIMAAWLAFARPAEPSPSVSDKPLDPRPAPIRLARLARLARQVGPGVALLLVLFALLRLLGPLVAAEAVPLDLDAVRRALTLASGPAGAITEVAGPSAVLAPWSRPPLDALRLALGLGLLASFASRHASAVPSVAPRRPVLLALLGLTGALAVGFLPEGVGGAAIVGLMALVAEVGEGPARRSAHVAILAAFLMLLFTLALAPITQAAPLLPW